MTKTTGLWLTVATCLILVGCIIFGGVMMALKWDFSKLSTSKYEISNHTISEPFRNISIASDTARIEFIPSEESQTKVVCYQQVNMKYTVSIQDNTLTIRLNDQRKWYDYIGIHFVTPEITVYIPKAQYDALTIHSITGDITVPEGFQFQSIDISLSTGDVTNRASAVDDMRIKTTTGDILVQNVSAGSVSLSVSTGKTQVSSVNCSGNITMSCSTGKTILEDIQCMNVISKCTTGDIDLNNVIATEALSISRNTGDISLTSCDANELTLKASTGDITGSLLTPKVFITNSSAGSINVPESVTGGKCKITTSTGNIRFTLD